ncbi:hypothetical protein NAPIS_ORF00032 [Vairimorpha apis BRL 01]|uniref:Uncharacterized protein n=1 Tax=Vairimorpha apis BRL 01 TaxID=1037528 RepID=T0MN29_9MICR|nr:hypothetical protein NAPIS_ORF00032 [Vairimorpha apis BRL 01]
MDHLATKCDQMLGFDYVRRHNEVKIRSHSVQEVMSNDNDEIRVDTKISTDIKETITKLLIVEVGMTNQDLLTIVENEKLRKYDLLANELGIIYKSKTKIIPYVMTWDGVVTTYHKKYIKKLRIQPSLEAYIQSLGDAGEVEVERTVEKLVESNYKYMEGKTMDPINNNQSKILDPEDLTKNRQGKITQ